MLLVVFSHQFLFCILILILVPSTIYFLNISDDDLYYFYLISIRSLQWLLILLGHKVFCMSLELYNLCVYPNDILALQ